MAKDYFQDIVPPNDGRPKPQNSERRMPQGPHADDIDRAPREMPDAPSPETTPIGIRSIRNIAPMRRERARISDSGVLRDTPSDVPGMPRPRPRSRKWMWIAAAISVVVVIILVLFAFRNTSVIVTPRSQPVTFDESNHFTAYPAASAASGTLSYVVEISDLEDSEVVQTQGTEHAETKASGQITIVNNFSSAPLRFVKSTRFAAPNGLIFRVPADVVIPAKKGSTPGEVTVTVVADAPGEQYNIGPTSRFTLPGLKSLPAEYATVYARSSEAMSGGFVGDQPAVAPGAMQAASASVRSRIESKIRDSISSRKDIVVFPDLVKVTYQTLPNTTEAGGGVRIHIKAHVEIPIFAKDAFTRAVARLVSADAETASINIVGGTGYAAHTTLSSSTPLGASPLDFTLSGQATLIWNVDTGALATALSGRDETAFQTIITGFAGIQEAHARIEPFWKNSFPSDPAKIKITVGPAAAATQ